ncbi:MAG: sugar kinase [Cytophagales bacterium]|nr:sugar kinase [Cytophagales bacterium]
MITCFGELLVRLSTQNFETFAQAQKVDISYGGAEANVAASLAIFGENVQYITTLPHTIQAQAASQSLQKWGVNTQNIVWKGTKMGLYYLETGQGLRGAKVVYDRAHSSFAEAGTNGYDWQAILKGTTWLHWSGISPAVSQKAADATLEALKAAHNMGITISADLNYRSKLWQYGATPAAIMEPLISHTHHVFGGIDAPEIYFGIVPKGKKTVKNATLTPDDLHSICTQFSQKFSNIKSVASTLRTIHHVSHHGLSGMVWHDDELYTGKTYAMHNMVDRVGGGDAFMAAYIYGLIHFGKDYKKILNFASAACALKHYIPADVNTSTLDDVNTLMNSDQISIISR